MLAHTVGSPITERDHKGFPKVFPLAPLDLEHDTLIKGLFDEYPEIDGESW